jgi:M6 family metalloprotease-like protein
VGVKAISSLKIFLVTSLLVSLLQPTAQAVPLEIEQCKLSEPRTLYDGTSISFPAIEHRVPRVGSHSQLIVAVDFPDAKFQFGDVKSYLETLANPKNISEFYETMSYGKVEIKFDIYPEVITLSKPFSYYLQNSKRPYSGENPLQPGLIMEETREFLQSKSVLQKYSALNIVETSMKATSEKFGGMAFAGPSLSSYPNASSLYPAYNNVQLVIGSTYIYGPKDISMLFAHEIGHLFGFTDIYNLTDKSEPVEYLRHPFDTMGLQGFGLGAWNRWLMGWVGDSQVVCLDESTNVYETSISALNLKEGLKAVVIRLSPKEVLIVEARRKDKYDTFEFDFKNYNGLAIHHLDTSIRSGKGAMKIYYDEELAVPVGQGDLKILSMASLAAKIIEADEYLYYKPSNILIENLYSDGTNNQVRISFRESALTNLKNAKAKSEAVKLEKAAAELKAKQESEAKVAAAAKAAAELKAKQEAEAKVAAEAKAAAELKAKQEAEAEVAAEAKAALEAKAASEAVTKKTTIICIKGKAIKKVTAVKPKCPKGYKKK